MSPQLSYDANPVKSFFVDMLTKDIELEDALLDLLDNCVDGAVRQIGKAGLRGRRPYEGFGAAIAFSDKSFEIDDNCGGIPEARRHYAFRMGAPPDSTDRNLPTVGTYGIGMKRALFKMGRHSEIRTRTGTDERIITFDASWFGRENDWQVPASTRATGLSEPGTRIVVKQLLPAVSNQFATAAFEQAVRERIATHYSLILSKGFGVVVNGVSVQPKPIRLRFDRASGGIKPYVFRTSRQGVHVFVAVGFTLPIPSEQEANAGVDGGRYKTTDAGWTIVCNDRTVLYCDKTALTGWGEAGVPRYHNQFIAISGVVEFRSDDASRLPTTTTKRGIDASSPLYLDIKNRMRDGMKLFTDYTNRWKGESLASRGKEHIERAKAIDFAELRANAARYMKLRRVSRADGEQFKPKLPIPKGKQPRRVEISFRKPADEVEIVADYLFGDPLTSPQAVGIQCFESMLRKAEK